MDKTCAICCRTNCKKLYNVQNVDNDQITYWEKLKSCIGSDYVLVEFPDMNICGTCLKHLRISYKFRETVLQSLQQENNESEANTEYCSDVDLSELKADSDSDNNYYSDASYKAPKAEPPQIFSCDFCGLQFPKRTLLSKHVIELHHENRKYSCSMCDKKFTKPYHLKEHLSSHTGEKNYACPICEKKFQRLSSQRRHIKSHDAPPGYKTKRTPFLCSICGKSFPFSNGVQRHMRVHLGIKNFECNLCHRKFTQSTHLHVHMRTHTGEKPYMCDTCGEKFSLKSCLLKHTESRHYRAVKVEEIQLEPYY